MKQEQKILGPHGPVAIRAPCPWRQPAAVRQWHAPARRCSCSDRSRSACCWICVPPGTTHTFNGSAFGVVDVTRNTHPRSSQSSSLSNTDVWCSEAPHNHMMAGRHRTHHKRNPEPFLSNCGLLHVAVSTCKVAWIIVPCGKTIQ